MKQQKGRAAPPRIDHQAVLANRLGRAAYEAVVSQPEFLPVNPEDPTTPVRAFAWNEIEAPQQAAWAAVGLAVLAQLTTAGNQRGDLDVASILSAQDGEPYVDLWASISPMQLSPGKAREIALLLLEAADAAESDAALSAFARAEMGLEDAQAAALIAHLRARRAHRRGKAVDAA